MGWGWLLPWGQPLTLKVGPGPEWGTAAVTVEGMTPGNRYFLQESSDLKTWGHIETFTSCRVMPILRPMGADRIFWRVGRV